MEGRQDIIDLNRTCSCFSFVTDPFIYINKSVIRSPEIPKNRASIGLTQLCHNIPAKQGCRVIFFARLINIDIGNCWMKAG